MEEDKDKINKIKHLEKDQFEALFQISQLFNSTEYKEALIEESLDYVLNVFNAERGLFVKFDEANDSFNIISARNINQETITNVSEFSSGILKQVVLKKVPVLYHDAQSDPNVSQFQSVLISKIKSVIGVPVFQKEKIWGVILLDSLSNRQEFNETNLVFLNFFSNLLSLSLDRIERLEKLNDENRILINRLQITKQIPDMIGDSNVMKELSNLIYRVAVTDATVLILGESGTGKDLVAQAIHKLSNRKENPFLGQFCGSIPDSLLESELFGFKKGAFTGANNDKKGLLEVANEGTFFLDEIADISLALQAKLLRVLENKEITRLGDVQSKKINVRIIAATNKDLHYLAKTGKFREDLFYRLNVFPIKIPPLRERKEDIFPLAQFFILKQGGKEKSFEDAAIEKLINYYWPGNVRQLLNVVQRALILSDGNKIKAENIILEDVKARVKFDGTLRDFEKQLLLSRLEECEGNRTQTASSLGVSVRWVQLKLKELGLQ